ncbi:MAG: DMT family transporter [Gammaproteobacteria bacterium]|nr:DMT family transporter [Gammaproteobacteria bacterium]
MLPVAALLIGASMWGVIWYPLRLFEQAGLSGLWATLLIYLAALPVGLLVFILRRSSIHNLGSLALLALASGWCNVAFILAVLDGNVVRIYLLFYLSPLWTVLLGWLLLGERIDRHGWITLGCAMLGAVIMLYDPLLGLPWPQDGADWLSITSGMAFALSNVLVRKLDGESVWTKTVFAWLGVLLLAWGWIVVAEEPVPEVPGQLILSALALGGVAMVIMSTCVIYGLTHLPAHRAAILLLFELVAAALSAQWLTDERVLLREAAGGALVLLAGYLAARRHMQTARDQ